MKSFKVISTSCLIFASVALAQDNLAQSLDLPPFKCPEPNGFFPDLEQCDLYYECLDGVAEPALCPDGLMFDDGTSIEAKCDYPFSVKCGKREYVQEPETGIDERCYRANGFFNHLDEDECAKFYQCTHGVAYELPCPTGTIFDESLGTCARPEDATPYAKACKPKVEEENIAGFSCPKEKTLGPHGQPLAHPSFPHPESCQKFITCYFSTDIKELGCQKGQVFDYNVNKCVDADVGPDDCKCWYECDAEISKACPSNCRSDCTCPSA